MDESGLEWIDFEPEPGQINDLPSGVLAHIFGYLGPRDLCFVAATCSSWWVEVASSTAQSPSTGQSQF